MCKGCEQRDQNYAVLLLGDGAVLCLLVAHLPTALAGKASYAFLVLCFPLLLVWWHFILKYETCLTACFMFVCAQRIKNVPAGSLHDLEKAILNLLMFS